MAPPADPQNLSPHTIGVMDGDGIGPEIVRSAVEIATAAANLAGARRVEWETLPMGLTAISSHGTALPDSTIERLDECDGFVLGPIDQVAYPPEERKKRNPSGELRHRFDLYANVRPAKNLPSVPAMARDTDLIVVRENTEGLYSDRNMFRGSGEFMPTPDVALTVGVITRKAAERVGRQACRIASERSGKLTVAHKANVLQMTNGLFLEAVRHVAAEFPDVQVEDYHIDAMAAHLVRRPDEFDVIVTENLFGDILSDLTAELVGGLGTGSSLNAGDDAAMAQAAHGSAPEIGGLDVANPIGEICSVSALLRWIGQRSGDESLTIAGNWIDDAVSATLESGVSTKDLGGSATTSEFTAAVVAAIQAGRG